jgi:hypothetical protein
MDMMTPDLSMFLWNIFILVAFVVPAVFFLLAQYKTLKAISPANREMSPGEVWFQLIPVFNLYWQFVVVTRIADSLLKEQVLLESQDDSILGIPDFDAVEAIGNRPTYKIGITWCTLFLLDILVARLQWVSIGHGIIQGLLLLSLMICWIIYWVELVKNKRKILHLHKPVA